MVRKESRVSCLKRDHAVCFALFLPISPTRNGFDSFSSANDGVRNVVGLRKRLFPERFLLRFPHLHFSISQPQSCLLIDRCKNLLWFLEERNHGQGPLCPLSLLVCSQPSQQEPALLQQERVPACQEKFLAEAKTCH